MGDIEVGKCEVCNQDNKQLFRNYFTYKLKCDCCNGNHFEIVRHCKECNPKPPRRISAVVKPLEVGDW